MYAETLLDIAMQHSDALVDKAMKGDDLSQNRLVNLWFKRIYNFCFKYLSDHDLAMEVSQKTFIALYQKINGLQSSDKFKPWLYRIATNACHEEARKLTTRKKYFQNDLQQGKDKRATGYRYNPDEQYQRDELSQLLQAALMTLSDEQREVVIMKEYEGLKFKEIAEILAESENTVKSRLYYGLTHLRKHFTANNITKETIQL